MNMSTITNTNNIDDNSTTVLAPRLPNFQSSAFFCAVIDGKN